MGLLRNTIKLISFVSTNILLPIIALLGIVIIADSCSLGVSSNTDVVSLVSKIRTNKSIIEVFCDLHNTITLIMVSFVETILIIKEISKRKIIDVNVKENKIKQDYCVIAKIKSIAIENNLNYLRI